MYDGTYDSGTNAVGCRPSTAGLANGMERCYLGRYAATLLTEDNGDQAVDSLATKWQWEHTRRSML